MPDIGNPIGVALEYINARNAMVERHKGAGRALLGNASRPTQLQFISMCNEYACRFADQMPMHWNEPEWAVFSTADMKGMQRQLDVTFSGAGIRIDNLATWEGMSELSKTYLAILRMRMTPQ